MVGGVVVVLRIRRCAGEAGMFAKSLEHYNVNYAYPGWIAAHDSDGTRFSRMLFPSPDILLLCKLLVQCFGRDRRKEVSTS